MKNKYIVYIVCILLIFMSVGFAFMYIFHPRVKYVDKEVIRVIESKIPERIDISFAPAKPDTVYPTQIKGQDLLVSKKTFKEALGGKLKKPYALLTLDVYGYASVVCDYLSGDVGIEFYKDNIIDDLKDELPKMHKWNWNSYLWGGSTGLIIAMIVYVLSG